MRIAGSASLVGILHLVLLVTTSDVYAVGLFSSSESDQEGKVQTDAQMQKTIEQYKTLLHDTPEKVRDEITKYRTNLAKINDAKRSLYNKLSPEAKKFLQNEQKFRKKLPSSTKDYPNGLQYTKKEN